MRTRVAVSLSAAVLLSRRTRKASYSAVASWMGPRWRRQRQQQQLAPEYATRDAPDGAGRATTGTVGGKLDLCSLIRFWPGREGSRAVSYLVTPRSTFKVGHYVADIQPLIVASIRAATRRSQPQLWRHSRSR